MPFISFDPEKCNRDHICIRECPFNILQAGADGLPEMISGAEAVCLKCGHCVAVCPTDAVTLMNTLPETCEPVSREFVFSEEAVAHLLKSRRSVRVYKDKPVPRDLMENLLDMVRWAPTAKNFQPVQWTVCDDREKLRRMAGLTVEWLRKGNMFPDIWDAWEKGEDMILRDAPVLAIAHASEKALNPPADCAIAVTSLELAASALGVGGCWAGFFMRAASMYAPLAQMLELPPEHKVYGALMLGYPKFRYHRIPPRDVLLKVQWL